MGKTLTYALLVFLAGASYGFIAPVVKVATENGVAATEFLPLQYLIAFAVMAAVFFVRRDKGAPPLTLARLAAVGICTSGCSLCFYQAAAVLPSSVALTLLFQYLWVDMILDCIVCRSLPRPATVASVVAVVTGGALAAGLFDGGAADLDPAGVALGLASAVFYGGFLFVSGRVGTDQPVALRTMMLSLGGFVVTLAFSSGASAGQTFDAQLWPYAIALAALGVVVPTNLISFASPHLSPSIVSIMASSELPVGVIAAWIALGDAPSALGLVGVVLVLGGIVVNQLPALLSTRARSKPQAELAAETEPAVGAEAQPAAGAEPAAEAEPAKPMLRTQPIDDADSGRREG